MGLSQNGVWYLFALLFAFLILRSRTEWHAVLFSNVSVAKLTRTA